MTERIMAERIPATPSINSIDLAGIGKSEFVVGPPDVEHSAG
jgi:hypothetical protein